MIGADCAAASLAKRKQNIDKSHKIPESEGTQSVQALTKAVELANSVFVVTACSVWAGPAARDCD